MDDDFYTGDYITMKLLNLMAVAVLIVFAQASYSATFTDDGEIRTIDGDNDGQIDDLAIGQFTFTVETAGVVTIDSVNNGFDSYMYLFDSSNTVIAENDDAAGGTFNSAIATTLDVGTYRVTIGAVWYSSADALLGYNDNWSYGYVALPGSNAEFGTWQLTVNTPTAIPLPGAMLLFLSALTGLGILRRQ